MPHAMNARQIRRAQEHKTRKEAAKLQKTTSPAALSDKAMAANSANAQLSTGPRTEEGKRTSSLNAVRTGLTGRTVLLSSDDAELYTAHVARFLTDHKPESDRQAELVQGMADSQWRMNRIPGLEMAIFAKGRREFASLFEAEEPHVIAALVDAETIVAYNRELTNLSRQEGRLRRQYAKDLAELQTLQSARTQPQSQAAVPATAASENGFELSGTELSGIDLLDIDLENTDLATLESYLGISAAHPVARTANFRKAA